jgi:hypothetical protein
MQMRIAIILAATLFVTACQPLQENQRPVPDIVGTWVVHIPDAPFPLHMFVFHSDGTVEQSNPDAGDPNKSDSNLMGAWRGEHGEYRGKAVEIAADRNTHKYASRCEISFTLKVSGDTLSGSATATFFDPNGRQVREPIQVSMTGERVVP